MTSAIAQRSKIASYTSGILFGAGWWLLIDVIVYFNNIGKSKDHHPDYAVNYNTYIPGIIGTIGFFLVNFLPRDFLVSNEESRMSPGKSLYIILAFTVTFAGIISGFWILFEKYAGEKYSMYGILMLAQSFFIFVATFIFRFLRPSTTESSSF